VVLGAEGRDGRTHGPRSAVGQVIVGDHPLDPGDAVAGEVVGSAKQE
jgi:hypothetical protein